MTNTAFLGDQKGNPYDFAMSLMDVKVKSITMTMSGDDVDGMTIEEVLELDHLRLFKTHGMLDSGYSSTISWSEFCGGFYMKTYDITTSGEASNGYQVPGVKTGNARVAIKFDGLTKINATLLAFSEYPSELIIRKGPQGMIVETNYIKN